MIVFNAYYHDKIYNNACKYFKLKSFNSEFNIISMKYIMSFFNDKLSIVIYILFLLQRKNNELPADLNVTITQIESSIRVLTMSPGEFDRLVSHLVDIINPFLENPSQLKEIVSVIIKQVSFFVLFFP